SKDEAPEEIKTFLKKIIVLLQALVIIVRTDNGTEFKNQVLKEYFDSIGISHQVSSIRTPQQNRVVERINRTLVEAARTMLIFSCALLSLWTEAIATAALYYLKNDHEDIGKLGVKGDIGFFIGYSATSTMAFEQRSSKPRLQGMTSGQISSGLDLTYAPSIISSQKPTERELDLLFKAMYYDYIADTAPTPTNSSLQVAAIPNTSQDVDELELEQQHVQQQDDQAPLQPKTVSNNVPNAMLDENTFENPFVPPSISAAESSSS
ncbi:retrovirus-related pol polyprotein from transposon TNT 1-94, partial [Tanacetum coccineum]